MSLKRLLVCYDSDSDSDEAPISSSSLPPCACSMCNVKKRKIVNNSSEETLQEVRSLKPTPPCTCSICHKRNNSNLITTCPSDSRYEVLQDIVYNEIFDSYPESSLKVDDDVINESHRQEDKKPEKDHQGRIRTFPHEVGNWASIFYVAYPSSNILLENISKECNGVLRKEGFLACESPLHISVSRTLIFKHPWINNIVQQLTSTFSKMTKFRCVLGSVDMFENDNATRCFLSADVLIGECHIDEVTDVVDEICRHYLLPVYYSPRRYHLSLFWRLGPIKDTDKEVVSVLNSALELIDDELLTFSVQGVVLKASNKLYNFPFQIT